MIKYSKRKKKIKREAIGGGGKAERKSILNKEKDTHLLFPH